MKPTKKSRRDGEVTLLYNDGGDRMLVMKGDYTADQIIEAAIGHEIDNTDDEFDYWRRAKYSQGWYKPVPQDDGMVWHHPRSTPCRGAYFASVLDFTRG